MRRVSKNDPAYRLKSRFWGVSGRARSQQVFNRFAKVIDRLPRPVCAPSPRRPARACPGIGKKVLTASLRALEADGLIVRAVLPGKPPPVEYALSPLGRLLPLSDAMAAWGEAYRQSCD